MPAPLRNMSNEKDIYATFTQDDEPTDLQPEIVLAGKYRLIKQIGKGAMGVVWQAHERVADRLVALKFVPKECSRFDDEMERMRKSFSKIHALNHQSICPTYSLEDDDEFGYFLVMKFLEGETLDDYRLRKDPKHNGLPLDQVLELIKPVAQALDYAHRNDVIHRDIKPSNIFLSETAKGTNVEIIDFGLADESGQQFDKAGTPAYMAPEQWQKQQQTAATDQYALAVIAYELLAGNQPFIGGNIENAVLKYDPEPIREMPEYVNAALQKALAKQGADRFASCQEFLAALSGTKKEEVVLPPKEEPMTVPPSTEPVSSTAEPESTKKEWWQTLAIALFNASKRAGKALAEQKWDQESCFGCGCLGCGGLIALYILTGFVSCIFTPSSKRNYEEPTSVTQGETYSQRAERERREAAEKAEQQRQAAAEKERQRQEEYQAALKKQIDDFHQFCAPGMKYEGRLKYGSGSTPAIGTVHVLFEEYVKPAKDTIKGTITATVQNVSVRRPFTMTVNTREIAAYSVTGLIDRSQVPYRNNDFDVVYDLSNAESGLRRNFHNFVYDILNIHARFTDEKMEFFLGNSASRAGDQLDLWKVEKTEQERQAATERAERAPETAPTLLQKQQDDFHQFCAPGMKYEGRLKYGSNATPAVGTIRMVFEEYVTPATDVVQGTMTVTVQNVSVIRPFTMDLNTKTVVPFPVTGIIDRSSVPYSNSEFDAKYNLPNTESGIRRNFHDFVWQNVHIVARFTDDNLWIFVGDSAGSAGFRLDLQEMK